MHVANEETELEASTESVLERKEAEYALKQKEFEAHKQFLATRMPLKDITRCCEMVKDEGKKVSASALLDF